MKISFSLHPCLPSRFRKQLLRSWFIYTEMIMWLQRGVSGRATGEVWLFSRTSVDIPFLELTSLLRQVLFLSVKGFQIFQELRLPLQGSFVLLSCVGVLSKPLLQSSAPARLPLRVYHSAVRGPVLQVAFLLMFSLNDFSYFIIFAF